MEIKEENEEKLYDFSSFFFNFDYLKFIDQVKVKSKQQKNDAQVTVLRHKQLIGSLSCL